MQFIPPILKQIEGFMVNGLSLRTKNADELNEHSAKIPRLWQQFYADKVDCTATVFGVYSDYESGVNHGYTVTVGTASTAYQAGLDAVTIEKGNYLVFKGKGPMPATVIGLWMYVWNYFETLDKDDRQFLSDFESYTGLDEVEIYIGIK